LRHPGRRRVERVRMLLDGEPIDAAELRYELDAWHIGALAAGPGAAAAIRDLAGALDRRLLLVHPDPGTVWAWLGGRRELASREVLQVAESRWPADAILAIGEPAEGIEGWRLTHRQARAAMAVAQRGSEREVRYADVGLLAAALGDEVLAGSLRDLYLAPLTAGRDGGASLRQTLRAYFAAQCNVSSTAQELGVDRKTVSARLRAVERRLGRPIATCAAELETALRLERTGGLTVVSSIAPLAPLAR
jgi:sugar diacid utilization regulator